MIWFDIRELERKIINNNFSEKEGFNYLLATLLLYAIFQYVPVTSDGPIYIFSHILFSVLLTVLTVYQTYKINRLGGNQDFIRRYVALSFVVGFRLFVFMIVLAIPIGVVLGLFNSFIGNSFLADVTGILIYLASGIIYYLMLVRSFKRINSPQNPPYNAQVEV